MKYNSLFDYNILDYFKFKSKYAISSINLFCYTEIFSALQDACRKIQKYKNINFFQTILFI